jgi:peptide/nickel transport system ATP-binding protein
MLELNNVSFRYSNKSPNVINNLNFRIDYGEVVGIKGDSGKGKTTFAKIIAGFIPPQQGEILLDKNPVTPYQYNPVQLVFQHPELAINPGWKMRKVLNEVDGFFPDKSLLYDLSINELWLDRYLHELSGGELQRIAVARILNNKTKFIIADEMTSMLDAITQAQIWNTILSFSKQNNAGIIIISHDGDLLKRLCDRIEVI